MFRLTNCPYGFHVLIYDGCKSTFEHPVYLFEQKKNLCRSIYVVSFGESTVAHPEKLQYLNINKLKAIRWNFCLKALLRYKNLFNSKLHNL